MNESRRSLLLGSISTVALAGFGAAPVLAVPTAVVAKTYPRGETPFFIHIDECAYGEDSSSVMVVGRRRMSDLDLSKFNYAYNVPLNPPKL